MRWPHSVPYLVPALGMGAEIPVGSPCNAAFLGSPKFLQGYRDKDTSSPVGTARNNAERKGV